jgi:hypothetical protein
MTWTLCLPGSNDISQLAVCLGSRLAIDFDSIVTSHRLAFIEHQAVLSALSYGELPFDGRGLAILKSLSVCNRFIQNSIYALRCLRKCNFVVCRIQFG